MFKFTKRLYSTSLFNELINSTSKNVKQLTPTQLHQLVLDPLKGPLSSSFHLFDVR